MRIHIDDIPEQGKTLTVEALPKDFPVLEEIQKAGECEFLSPITFRLKAIRVGQIVSINGVFDAMLRLTCCRCLKNYNLKRVHPFDMTYTHDLSEISENTGDAEIALEARQMGLIYFQDETIDLKEGLQEQLVMAIPIHPLCTEGCRGLCPACGADLNQGDCGCDRTPADSRFAVLKDFKVKPG